MVGWGVFNVNVVAQDSSRQYLKLQCLHGISMDLSECEGQEFILTLRPRGNQGAV